MITVYVCCKKQKCRPKPVVYHKPAYTPPPAYGNNDNTYQKPSNGY